MPKTVFTPLQETNDPNVISQWLQDNRAARERFGRIGRIARAGNPEDEAIIRNARQMAAEYDKIQALIQQSQPAPQQTQRREEAPSLGTAATGLILGNRRMDQERITKEAYGVAEKTEVERRYNQLREARQRLGSIPDDKPFERSRVRGEIERLERDLDPKNVRSPEARQYASDIIRQERNEFVNEHLQRLEARRSSLDPRQPDYDREYAKITSQIERTNEYSRFVQDGMTDAERGLVRAGQEISSWGVVPRAFFVTGSGFIDMLSSPTNIVSMAAGGRPSSQRFISEGLNAPERQTFSERRGEWNTEKLNGFSNLVSQAMYSLPMTLITAVNAPLGVALTYTNMVDMNLTDMVRKYGSVDEVPAMSLAGSVASGVISGAVESLSNVVQVGIVNKLFKTSGFSGAKGYLKSILTNKGALLNFAKGSLQGSLIEGAEEWVDQLAGNLVYNMVGEQNKSLSEMIAESNQAFLSGAFGGALFGIFGGGYQGFTQRGHWATAQKLAKGGNAQARLVMEIASELQNDKPDIARVRAATKTLMRQVEGIKNKSLKTAAANILDLTYANGIVKTVFEEMKRQYPNNPAIQAIDTEKISQDVYSLYQRINKISPEDRKSMSGRSKITLLNTLRAALQEASFGRTDKAKAVLAGLSKLSNINRVSQDQFYESFNKIVTDLSGLVSQLDSSVVSYNEARATETPAPRFDDQLVERAKSANSSKEIGTPELENVSRDLQLAIDTTENPAERSMYGVWKRVIDQRIEKRKERDAPVVVEEAPKVESPKEAPKVQSEPVKPVTPVNAGQTKIIIELKAEKAISDADYRAMLQEVSGGRADTAGNLSLAEAATVIDRLQEMPMRKKKSEQERPDTSRGSGRMDRIIAPKTRIPSGFRELSGEEQGGAFTSQLKKGDVFTIGDKEYTVVLDGKKFIRIKSNSGKTYTINKYFTKDGKVGSYAGGESKTDQVENLFRDIEGQITLDLLNENNPFHEISFVTKTAIAGYEKQAAEKKSEPKKSEPKAEKKVLTGITDDRTRGSAYSKFTANELAHLNSFGRLVDAENAMSEGYTHVKIRGKEIPIGEFITAEKARFLEIEAKANAAKQAETKAEEKPEAPTEPKSVTQIETAKKFRERYKREPITQSDYDMIDFHRDTYAPTIEDVNSLYEESTGETANYRKSLFLLAMAERLKDKVMSKYEGKSSIPVTAALLYDRYGGLPVLAMSKSSTRAQDALDELVGAYKKEILGIDTPTEQKSDTPKPEATAPKKSEPKAEKKSEPKVVVDKYYISLRTGKPDQFHLEVSGKPVLKEEYPEWDLFLHHSYSYSSNLGTEESKTWSVSSGLTGLAVVSYIKTRAEAIEKAKKRLDSFKADKPDRYAEAFRYAQENARSPRYGTKFLDRDKAAKNIMESIERKRLDRKIEREKKSTPYQETIDRELVDAIKEGSAWIPNAGEIEEYRIAIKEMEEEGTAWLISDETYKERVRVGESIDRMLEEIERLEIEMWSGGELTGSEFDKMQARVDELKAQLQKAIALHAELWGEEKSRSLTDTIIGSPISKDKYRDIPTHRKQEIGRLVSEGYAINRIYDRKFKQHIKTLEKVGDSRGYVINDIEEEYIKEVLKSVAKEASPQPSRQKLSDTLSKSLTSEQVDATMKLYDAMFQSYADELGITLDEAYEYLSDVVTTMPEGQFYLQQENAAEIAEAERQMEEVRSKYEGTEQWMKAPNGKPTKLNERQWLQVRTENFKKWFGDWENDPENASKVVDKNGEPMVVYHGANSDMDTYDWQFKKEYLGKNTKAESAKKAFFFAKDKNTAMSPHYAGINYDVVSGDIKAIGEEIREAVGVAQRLDVWSADEIAKDIDNGHPFIDVGAYRSVLDPRDIPNNIVEALENLRNGIEENSDGEEDADDAIETLTNLINMYSDTYATEELMSDWLLVHELFLNIRNPNTYDYRGSRERAVTYADLLDEASDEGMDGAIFYNTYDGGDLDNIYAAFTPTQIKSATANVGTFDAENPDIRYQSIRGFVQFKGGKVTLGIVDPDFSTAVHEQAHIGLRIIRGLAKTDKTGKWKTLLEKAEDFAGVDVDTREWNEEAEERFAMGYEKYLLEGKAPNPQVATLFGKIKQWMSAIVGKAKELAGLKLDDNIISVYDAMLGVERVKPKAIKLNANKSVKTPLAIMPTGYNYDKEINIANTQYGAGISTPAEYMKWWHKRLGGKGDKVLFEKYGKIGDIRAVTLGLDKYIDTIRMEYSDNFKKQQDAWVGDSPARRMWVDNRLGYSEEQNQKIDELIHTVEEYYVKELADKEILSISGVMVGDENIGVLSKNVYGAKHLLVNAMQGGYVVSHEKDGVSRERMPGAKIVGTRLDYPAGYPEVDELIDDIIMQEYIKKNSKPIKSVIDEGVVSGSQRIAVYPNAREFFSDSTPKPVNIAYKSNLNKEQKSESVKIKNNLKLKSDNTAKTLEKELDSLLDKFGNLVYSKPSSKKILINNVDLNRNIIEITEEDGFIVNGKAFPSVYDAMQEVTRLLSDSSSTNSVTLKQIKRINFSDDILFQRNIEISRDISKREKKIIAEAYGRVSLAISKSMSFSEWRNSLIDLVDTLIKTKHGAEKVDALALSSVADVNFISAALSRQTKYETILRDMTGFSNVDEVSTLQLFELVQQLDPDFYNTISNNEYLNNLLEATDRVSRALGVDSEIAMSDIFRVTMGESRKFARFGAITKNVARPAEVIISAFGNAGRNLVVQTYKGKLLHAKIQNRSAMTMRGIDKVLNTNKNSAGRRYTADEKDLIGRMIFYIGSNEAIQNHRMAFKDEVERSNKVSSEQVDIADVLSIYDSIRDLMTYFEAEGMALNERVGKEIFFSRPEYIFRVFQTVASPIVDELESQEIQLAEAPNLKRRERKVPEMSKLNVDIIPALKGYVNRTSRYISYYELKDYYQNRFAKDVPSNLKSRASELRKYLVNYINAAIGSYEKKSRFDVVMSQARLNLYASVLSSNIGLTLQNFNQRNLASVYAAPKVFRKVIRDARFFSGKPSKRMRSSKLMELMDELHSSGENQMTEFYREGDEALMESKDIYARGTLNISGKVMKYAPFTVAERGNWSYGYLTGIYNAVMASRQYQKAIKEGKTHYEATEIALSNQQVRDAAIISAGEINAAINADPSLVFSPAMYQTQVGKWMFFTKFFVNFLNLARNVADMKGISGRWSRELFNYQLYGTDEQARITDRVRSLNLMLEDLSPKNIKAMLAKHGSRLSSAGMDSKDFAKMYVEIKKLRDEQVELLRDTNTNFLTGSRLQRKMLSRLAAYAFGDFLIQIIMQALRYWLADVNPGDIYSRKLRGKIMKKNEMDVLGSVLAATQVSRLGQGFGLWSGLFPKLDTRTTKGAVKSATTWGLNLVPGLGLLDSTAGQIYGARPTHIILDDLFEDK